MNILLPRSSFAFFQSSHQPQQPQPAQPPQEGRQGKERKEYARHKGAGQLFVSLPFVRSARQRTACVGWLVFCLCARSAAAEASNTTKQQAKNKNKKRSRNRTPETIAEVRLAPRSPSTLGRKFDTLIHRKTLESSRFFFFCVRCTSVCVRLPAVFLPSLIPERTPALLISFDTLTHTTLIPNLHVARRLLRRLHSLFYLRLCCSAFNNTALPTNQRFRFLILHAACTKSAALEQPLPHNNKKDSSN